MRCHIVLSRWCGGRCCGVVVVSSHHDHIQVTIDTQVAEKRARSMEAATEFVQGGDCGNQFTTLLRDVMRAAGAGGMEADERVQELSRLQKMVRDCVLSLMI
jgi:hypothetical protein